jgi:uncharacterized protein
MRRRTSALLVTALIASTLPLSPLSPAVAQTEQDDDIVISAMRTRGPGGAFDEIVELHNLGEVPVDISGWGLQGCAGGSGAPSNRVTVDADTDPVPPGGFFLFVNPSNDHYSGGTTPDATYSNGIADGSGAGAQLVDAEGEKVTGIGAEDSDCREGAGIGSSFPGSAPFTFVRADDRTRATGDNAEDFDGPTDDVTPRNSAFDSGAPIPIVAECQDLTVVEGQSGSATQTASDADGTVTDVAITDGEVDGISLGEADPADGEGGTLSVDLLADDGLDIGDYEVELTFSNDDPEPQTATCDVTVAVQGDICAVPLGDVTPINEIQGSGDETPLAGETVVTRGVVTTDFTSGGASGIPANQGFRGFHIEAIADDRDDDEDTSEGLFVFDGSGTFQPEIGTLVHVEGTAGEAFEITQIDADRIGTCDEDPAALPAAAALPLPTPVDARDGVFEPLESMRVTHPELTVVEFFQIERFGEIRLSSDGVLQNPTNVVEPGSDAYADLLASNAANNIVLDDGRSGQNLDPLPYVAEGDTLRIGDQAIDEDFVLHYAFNAWRLQPIDVPDLTEEFRTNRTRPRPESPPEVGGTLTVGAFNVLNYFNGDGYFIGDDESSAAGFPTARGARSVSEFERQTEKIVDAVVRMDADVLGLIEIENDAGDDQAAAALVDAVNTELGTDTYDYVDTGAIGTDAIKLAFIYQPENVEPTGDYAILDTEEDARFDDQRNRPVLAQTFTEVATGESVTVANNHLKSKGSGCGTGDDDTTTGQGNCNGTRTDAAEAMADWLADDPTGQDATGTMIVGDLNSYAMEDPIDALKEAGYTDLLDEFAPEGTQPYTYTFDATQGYLDYAMADAPLLETVTGAAAWNINADEVPAIDYLESGNGRFRTEDVAKRFYDPSAFRSSDHDPVLVGLDLAGEDVDPEPGTLECPDGEGSGFPDVPDESVHADNIRCGDDLGIFAGKADGSFDPRGSLTRGQAATVLDRIATAIGRPIDGDRRSFSDVEGSYVHRDAIERLGGAGVLSGSTDGTFRPQEPIARDQLASVVVRFVERMTDEELPLGDQFADVPADNVHADNLRKARAAGIVIGTDDGNALPRQDIRRDQAASLFVRSLDSLPVAD